MPGRTSRPVFSLSLTVPTVATTEESSSTKWAKAASGRSVIDSHLPRCLMLLPLLPDLLLPLLAGVALAVR